MLLHVQLLSASRALAVLSRAPRAPPVPQLAASHSPRTVHRRAPQALLEPPLSCPRAPLAPLVPSLSASHSPVLPCVPPTPLEPQLAASHSPWAGQLRTPAELLAPQLSAPCSPWAVRPGHGPGAQRPLLALWLPALRSPWAVLLRGRHDVPHTLRLLLLAPSRLSQLMDGPPMPLRMPPLLL